MDSSRVYRFVIPGWLLVSSLGFHYWVLGGDLSRPLAGQYSAIVGILGALAAGPLLGFVASTITVRLLESLHGDQLHFDVPETKRDCLRVVGALRKSFRSKALHKRLLLAVETQLGQGSPDRLPRKDRSGLAGLLFPLHNLALRVHAPRELLDFTARRWTIFWSHANSVGALLLGVAGACAVRLLNEQSSFSGQVFGWQRAAWDAPWLIYLLIAYTNAKKARNEAIEIERDWLIEFAADHARGKTDPASAHEPSPPTGRDSSSATT